MKLKLITMAAAVALSGAAYGQKDDAGRKAKQQEEERIEQQAKADRERCNQMKGNAKDVCEAQAKGKERVAKAELDAKYDSSPTNQRKVAEAKLNAEYDVAKERCEDQKGEAKDQCQKAAKDQRDMARKQVRDKYAQRPASTGAAGRTQPATK
ncbi:MAG TPA: hypothetical protein VFC18_13405 [Burkholderiales bacterium]|nr:hypothetical protein [Burkholderiales bacterium]